VGRPGVKLLLDTHIWLWSHLEPDKLGKKVSAALTAKGAEIWLSPISVWEFLLLVERRRIHVEGEPHAWIEDAWARAATREAALTREVAIQSRKVRVPHEDPADRFLAATAVVHDLVLVTGDANLLAGKGYATLPNR
jgi:PIN domain nuclease of toxin-antitoxin system